MCVGPLGSDREPGGRVFMQIQIVPRIGNHGNLQLRLRRIERCFRLLDRIRTCMRSRGFAARKGLLVSCEMRKAHFTRQKTNQWHAEGVSMARKGKVPIAVGIRHILGMCLILMASACSRLRCSCSGEGCSSGCARRIRCCTPLLFGAAKPRDTRPGEGESAENQTYSNKRGAFNTRKAIDNYQQGTWFDSFGWS